MIRIHRNPGADERGPYPFAGVLNAAEGERAAAAITACPRYEPTPLIDLTDVAAECGVAAVAYKHEGGRFGLGSFKALGGAYAVARALIERLEAELGRPVPIEELAEGRHRALTARYTAVSATDGNHGRSVAAGARHFGCACTIFLHEHVSQGREDAIAAFGARIMRVAGDYDLSVREAARAAQEPGAMLLADGSNTDDQGLSRHVLHGYYVMTGEALKQLGAPPTHVLVQGGVGSLAAAVCAHYWETLGEDGPKINVVEPDKADCLYQSALAGEPAQAKGGLGTLMAGLDCSEVSIPAWRILERGAHAFVTIPDEAAVAEMRRLARAAGDRPAIVAGESAVAGLAGLVAAAGDPQARLALGLDETSRVLLFGTEGATDPVLYELLTGLAPFQVSL